MRVFATYAVLVAAVALSSGSESRAQMKGPSISINPAGSNGGNKSTITVTLNNPGTLVFMTAGAGPVASLSIDNAIILGTTYSTSVVKGVTLYINVVPQLTAGDHKIDLKTNMSDGSTLTAPTTTVTFK